MKTRSQDTKGWIESRTLADGTEVFLYRWRESEGRDGNCKNSMLLEGVTDRKSAEKQISSCWAKVNGLNLKGEKQLREFVQSEWKDYLRTRAAKPSTRASFKSILEKHILPVVGESSLIEIEPEEITALFMNLADQGLSRKYRKNIYSLLDTLFDLANQLGYISKSPIRSKMHRPKVSEKKRLALSASQMTCLLIEIPVIWKTLFLLLATTGMRIGEALALRWMDVDFELRRIRISHTLFRGSLQEVKTEASHRHVPIAELLTDALKGQLEASDWKGPEDFVFHGEGGKPLDPNWLRKKVLYPAMDRAKIARLPRQSGFHLFRHTVASLVHKETGSSKLAQQLLGHSDPSLTKKIYIHPDEEELRNAVRTVTDGIFCPQGAHTESSSGEWVN